VVLSLDREIEALRTKKERLGIAFADGTIKEETYKSKLRQLKKQEADGQLAIGGAIPGQVLDTPTQGQLVDASIISSARGIGLPQKDKRVP